VTYDLSILIAARNEFYYDLDLLSHTVTNVLENSGPSTDVIVICDGSWPMTPLDPHPRLTLVHHNKSIGQRAAVNEAARLSKSKYIMKLDAHSAMSKDFDTVLMNDMQPNWMCVPLQFNLLCFEWKCKRCGWIKDQSPKPEQCGKCRSQFLKQVVIWKPRDGQEGRRNTPTHTWRFDSKLEFQYWGQFTADEAYCKKHNIPFRADQQGDIHDTMSLLGACWMLERELYWAIDGLDEKMGSWGQMGTELALKILTSGNELKVNKRAWFSHFFRVGGIGFPYPDGGRKERAMARCRELWMQNQWPKQIRPLSWVIEKFSPAPDWDKNSAVTQEVMAAGEKFYKERGIKASTKQPKASTQPKAGVLFYTCSTLADPLATAVRTNLKSAVNGHEIGSVSRERLDFGDWNIVLQLERGPLAMHEQILAGLERMQSDYVFLCEHDVLYHPSHFEFIPPTKDKFYYNVNVWRVRETDGHAVRTDDCRQVSGLCASRELLIDHYRKRVERIRREGFSRKNGYEPGTKGLPHGYDNSQSEVWSSPFPNLDIRHGNTLTSSHWTIDSFRNPKYARGWRETDDAIEPWPKLTDGGLQQLLIKLSQ
jgi:hypothetical protein